MMYVPKIQREHRWGFSGLLVAVILIHFGITGLAYYVSQVAFVDMVVELQFTAYQGAVVIENSSAIWKQVVYSSIYTVINIALLLFLWYRNIFATIVRVVSTYWILGMNILTLTGMLYYIMLVIQNNA